MIVSDIEKSLTFYRDLLGLNYVGSNPVWFGTIYRLRFGNSDLKLIDASTTPPNGPSGLTASLGIRYVTFVIKNLDEICDKLSANGIIFEKKPTEIRPGVRIAMALDPDENVVEFVQIS